jgi:hypothetical protein
LRGPSPKCRVLGPTTGVTDEEAMVSTIVSIRSQSGSSRHPSRQRRASW